MKGILIEFDCNTGQRAGDISPRDPKLRCHGWQNLEAEDVEAKGYEWRSGMPGARMALEIRVIFDDRDLDQYDGVPGVTVLGTAEEINAAIDSYMPDPFRYSIADEVLFNAHVKQKGVDLDKFKGKKAEKVLADLSARGVLGIQRRKRYDKL